MLGKEVFEFRKSCTGENIPYHIGRFQLASGNWVSLFFTPDGLKMAFGLKSMTNGDLIIVAQDDGRDISGLLMPIKKQDHGKTDTTRHEGDAPSVQSGEGETQENQEDL